MGAGALADAVHRPHGGADIDAWDAEPRRDDRADNEWSAAYASTGKPAARHSGKPSSIRRAL